MLMLYLSSVMQYTNRPVSTWSAVWDDSMWQILQISGVMNVKRYTSTNFAGIDF
ncbi:MAG: hypothetical protein U5L72_19475 [Bacteroidales bacterium]|nr:hypothetical protein [Bacteroidales bacterium]